MFLIKSEVIPLILLAFLLAAGSQDQTARLNPDVHRAAALKPRLTQPLAGKVQRRCAVIAPLRPVSDNAAPFRFGNLPF